MSCCWDDWCCSPHRTQSCWKQSKSTFTEGQREIIITECRDNKTRKTRKQKALHVKLQPMKLQNVETETGILIQTLMSSNADPVVFVPEYNQSINTLLWHEKLKIRPHKRKVSTLRNFQFGLFLQKGTELTLFWRSGRAGGAFVFWGSDSVCWGQWCVSHVLHQHFNPNPDL